jgi:serine phosphatase RsbU (regulator of sigma subunit)
VSQAPEERFDLRSLLASVENAPPIAAVHVLGAKLAQSLHASHVSLLIANFSGDAVVRLSHVSTGAELRDGHNERVESISLVGPHRRVLWSQQLEVVRDGDEWLALVPVSERGDAIGILELSLAHEPDGATLEHLLEAAHALAYVLITSRRHTDLFEWAQRDIPFSIAAEIQRRLLPSAYTAEGGPFTLAGWLEPSHSAGGDTFDYSIDREHLYASITDAMGHSVEAAMLATLTVSTLRNSRRMLASPVEQADVANAGLQANARDDQFVTALVMRVRLADGIVEVVNAGHPLPYMLRAGEPVSVPLRTQAPLGVQRGSYDAQSFQLLPGDRLLLITDGYLERNAARIDIESVLIGGRCRHPRQVVQELAHNVLRVTGGKLRDDATAVCIDWFGPRGSREATGGASRARATDLSDSTSPLAPR